jgi:hypothetical protein
LSHPRKIIAYRPDALAPHQGLLSEFVKCELPDTVEVIIRTIPTNNLKRIFFALRVALDAILYRGAILYFASFLSVAYAAIPGLLGHRRYIYHSQDWIADAQTILSRLELQVVRCAPIVIWNEPGRAARAKEMSGRKGDILILPTYLPREFFAPERSDRVRQELAKKSGVALEDMIVIFAGGGFSSERLSEQFIEAQKIGCKSTVTVFTGTNRLPDIFAASNIVDLGCLSYEEMFEVMASSDIGLLLYDYANSFGHQYQQPGRLTDYLKCGLAIIATPFLDARRLQAETNFCEVVDGYNVEELSIVLDAMADRITSREVSPELMRKYVDSNMAYEDFATSVLDRVFAQLPYSFFSEIAKRCP